jgi:hypothetical protein
VDGRVKPGHDDEEIAVQLRPVTSRSSTECNREPIVASERNSLPPAGDVHRLAPSRSARHGDRRSWPAADDGTVMKHVSTA